MEKIKGEFGLGNHIFKHNKYGIAVIPKESIKEKTADEYIDKLEEKLMYALSPTNHELALETKRNFKKIIRKNIDEDTYTIKRELKKYWDNMNTYWLGDDK